MVPSVDFGTLMACAAVVETMHAERTTMLARLSGLTLVERTQVGHYLLLSWDGATPHVGLSLGIARAFG